jgi:E3 ubiquitin-protein ligase HUWE1
LFLLLLAYTVDFLDALFTLLTFLLQTSSGGTMLMSAGIMSTLIQVLDHPSNSNPIYRKAFIKVIGLLDTIMSNINTSFSSFCNANGLDVLLKVIKTQVDECIEQSIINQQPPNHDALTLVKNTLRFLIRMMESSDTADGLRNLIESSIPHTIMKVMEHHSIFGPGVFALVINVATTFIHNEPTSLSVLQEIKLPQTFLKTFESYQQPNFEVLMASVHSFGAICLNGTGLDMFNQANPLPHFFNLMTAPSFVTNTTDVGNATALGTTMDELIRHHPKLKGEVFRCANQLLQQVIEVGHSEKGKPVDNCHELVYENRDQDPPTERAECLLLGFVDLVARVSRY